LCGADQLRMTAATDVTTPTKTRQEIAVAIQNVLRWFRGR
jgi:hypothetical protein